MRWFSPQYGTKYNLVRTEEVYRELKGKERWYFIVIPTNSGDKQRLALEVKRIMRPHIRRQHSQWRRIIDQVCQNLGQTLIGKYFVSSSADLNPPKGTRYHVLNVRDKRGQANLINVLTDVIGKNITNMAKSESGDLGPLIRSQFPTWPVWYSRNVPQACIFLIFKTSDQGSQIEVEGHDAYVEEAAVAKAIEKVRGSSQLDLARQKGIERTILLLDLSHQFTWDPVQIVKILADNSFHSISCIYLVQVPAKIEQVWSAEPNPSV
jgi:hypothetical protein